MIRGEGLVLSGSLPNRFALRPQVKEAIDHSKAGTSSLVVDRVPFPNLVTVVADLPVNGPVGMLTVVAVPAILVEIEPCAEPGAVVLGGIPRAMRSSVIKLVRGGEVCPQLDP